MKLPSIAPTGEPQPFEVHETFFSTTDARGVITAGNEVFCRISGYAFDAMVGQPHNLIRHPDVPRIVFRLLWETVQAGRPFSGYVKNLARNGNYYWVFAVIVPVPGGYLSVRIKPTSDALPQVESLYRQLADIEGGAIAAGRSESQAAEAALPALLDAIGQLGFSGYEAFSHFALNSEIKSRDAVIASRGLQLFPLALGLGEEDGGFGRLYVKTLSAYDGIKALFASLDSLLALCRGIRQRQDAVHDIAKDFRLNALNAHIAAHPLGAEGVTLGAVAQILGSHAHELSRNVEALAENIVHTTAAVEDVASNLSAARIQIEMLLSFLAEIAGRDDDATDMLRLHGMAGALRSGLTSTVDHALRAVEAMRTRLPDVFASKDRLRKDIVFLRVAQISGLVEVSRLSDGEDLGVTFTGLREQIRTAQAEMEQLDQVVGELSTLANNTPAIVKTIERSMHDMEEVHLHVRGVEQRKPSQQMVRIPDAGTPKSAMIRPIGTMSIAAETEPTAEFSMDN